MNPPRFYVLESFGVDEPDDDGRPSYFVIDATIGDAIDPWFDSQTEANEHVAKLNAGETP